MKKSFKAMSGIFPMPVLIIGTYNEDGSTDVMNAAWGMAISMKEIKLCLSESHKTFKNLKRTGACTVSLGTKELMIESDYFGIVSANSDKDKFENSHLHSTKSIHINAPIVDEYPLTMECKLASIDEDGVVLDIINTLVDEKYLLEDGSIDLEKMGVLSYDPYGRSYYVVDKKVGSAFQCGKVLK